MPVIAQSKRPFNTGGAAANVSPATAQGIGRGNQPIPLGQATPNSLTGLQGWWAADAISSPPADGAALQTWTDSSGNSRSFSQATVGNRPTYRTSGTFLPGGRPCVEFTSASSTYMTTTTAASTGVFTRFALVRLKTVGSSTQVVYGGVSGQVFALPGTVGRFSTLHDSTGSFISNYGSSVATVGNWYIFCWADDGNTNHDTYVNGPQDGRTTVTRASSSSSAAMTLGARNNGTFGTNCYLAEVIDYNRVLNSTERGQIFSYLAGKYALSLSSNAITDLVLDWDTGNNSQWLTGVSALEAGAPAHQSTFSQTVRRGTTGWAWRAEIHNDVGDKANNSYRCLLGKYDSQEGPPGAHGASDFAYGFSFRVAIEENVAARLAYSQIWELHHRANMYNVPGLSLAPHAIELINGNVEYRVVAGAGNWNGSTWTGWSTYNRNNVILTNFQTGTWYDVVVRIKCSEGSDGITQVWIRVAGASFTGTPQFLHNGPTLPFIPGGVDPSIPTKISTADVFGTDNVTGLYLEAGLYNGSSNWQSGETTPQQIVYFDGMRRYATSAAAMAAFPP